MIKHSKKKEKINFLLENKHYRKLHLILYFLSVIAIVLVYFLTIMLFSKYVNILVTAMFSLILGTALVFHRDKLVKKVSEKVNERKRKDIKKNNKEGLKTTLKKITPKRNVKFNISKKTTIKEKLDNIKRKFKSSPKSKKNKEYLEIKD